ncbi:hypothetical protein FQN54_008400 [Arachnomyces sp. PD_36]|nr:hypothetical protein FQN54_008400 [Arachnomyces sp. PD_36]
MLSKGFPLAPEPDVSPRTCHYCKKKSTPLWRRDELGSIICNVCFLRRFVIGRQPPRQSNPATGAQREPTESSRIASSTSQQQAPSNAPEGSAEAFETPDHVDEQKNAKIFEGLDEIEWATVKHCYGFAGDVPGWLRGLRSPSRSARDTAWRGLEDNLIHQETSYEASALSVPFFLRMIADEQTRDREKIIYFLAQLAIGDTGTYNPRKVDAKRIRGVERDWRDVNMNEIVKKGDDESRDAYEGRLRMRESQRNEIVAGVDCYNAVQAGLSTLLSLFINDRDPSARVAAAYTMAWFPENARSGTNATLPVLMDFLERNESHPSVVASTTLAASSLVESSAAITEPNVENDNSKLVWHLQKRFAEEDGAFVVRWAAAKALISLKKEDSDTILFITTSLLKAQNRGGFDTDIPPFCEDLYGGSQGMLRDILHRNHGESAAIEAVESVVHALSKSTGLVIHYLMDLALTMVFHGSKPPPHPTLPSFEQLNKKQQMVVRCLTDMSDETWDDIWFSGACRQRGLPGSRTDCREYAQIAS